MLRERVADFRQRDVFKQFLLNVRDDVLVRHDVKDAVAGKQCKLVFVRSKEGARAVRSMGTILVSRQRCVRGGGGGADPQAAMDSMDMMELDSLNNALLAVDLGRSYSVRSKK